MPRWDEPPNTRSNGRQITLHAGVPSHSCEDLVSLRSRRSLHPKHQRRELDKRASLYERSRVPFDGHDPVTWPGSHY